MSKLNSHNRFVTRYAVRHVFKNEKGEMESAIVLTNKKTVCPESEQFKYYAKLGGFLNLKDLNTQKVKDLLPKLNMEGFYLIMATHRTVKGPDTYALVCSQMKSKLLDIPISPLVSFLPRIDGTSGEVLCGLRIHPNGDKTKNREWTRFQGLSSKSSYQGFNELKASHDYNKDYQQNSHAKYAGFYVNKNCSLVIYDIGTIDPNKTIEPQQNRTLIQEGGFVYVDSDLVFKLAEDTEDKLLTANELFEKFKDSEKSVLGTDRYKKSHFIRDSKEPKHKSVVFFLNPSTYLLPYELHITDDHSKDKFFKGKRVSVLFIPNGAQFEYCEFWELADGIQSVAKRQKKEPWNKYLQRVSDAQNLLFEDKINDIPVLSYPAENKNEKTPQSEEFYKMIRKARKGVPVGPKDSGKKEPEKEKSDKDKDEKEKAETKDGKQMDEKPKDDKPKDEKEPSDKDKSEKEKSDKDKSDKEKSGKEKSDKDSATPADKPKE